MLYKNENYCAQQLAWSIEEYTKQVDVFSTVKDLNPVLFQHKSHVRAEVILSHSRPTNQTL